MHIGNLGDRWGAETSPSGFELQTLEAINQTAPGIVDYASQIQTVGESLIQAIARARATLSMSDFQAQMLDIQLARAQAGQPPLSTQNYLSGGFDQKTILLIVAALAALYLITRKG
jgi:hypothetical protein